MFHTLSVFVHDLKLNPHHLKLTLIIFPSAGIYNGRLLSRSLVCRVLKRFSSFDLSSTLGGFSVPL